MNTFSVHTAVHFLKNGVQVRQPTWPDSSYLYMDNYGVIRNQHGYERTLGNKDRGTSWVRYETPKPKVKRWLWAFKQDECWRTTCSFYTEQEFKNICQSAFPNKKLDYTETEFED